MELKGEQQYLGVIFWGNKRKLRALIVKNPRDRPGKESESQSREWQESNKGEFYKSRHQRSSRSYFFSRGKLDKRGFVGAECAHLECEKTDKYI